MHHRAFDVTWYVQFVYSLWYVVAIPVLADSIP